MLKPELSKESVGLDLGCGTGVLTFKIAKLVKKIIGLDISDKMIQVARNKNIDSRSNIIFKKADISEKLEFPDNKFNFVISVATLCHINSLARIYREVHRVLKPGGVFIFDEIISKLNKPFRPKYNDYLKEFTQNGTIIWSRHTLEDHLIVIKRLGFKLEKVIKTNIDEEIKNVFNKEDFKVNKGCRFTTIIKVRK